MSARYHEERQRLERVAQIRARATELGPDSAQWVDLEALASDEEIRAVVDFGCTRLTRIDR
jgi:hypothetical protein